MTAEQKKRYEQLDKIVCDSIREMWAIMAPTEEEVNEAAEMIVCDDSSGALETITDETSPIGMLYMLCDIEMLRDCTEEEDNA